MPHRDWKFRIRDILDSIDAIANYTNGMSLETFAADKRTVDAVVRRLTVIGEAATHVPDAVCSNTPGIPWKDMRGMRNFVVHEYFGVSDSILWETIRRDLPSVVEPLRRLLDSSGT